MDDSEQGEMLGLMEASDTGGVITYLDSILEFVLGSGCGAPGSKDYPQSLPEVIVIA